MFDPGDNKILLPEGDVSPASRRLTWVLVAMELASVVVGIACCATREWTAGVILAGAGSIATVITLRPVITERRMIRRMQQRNQRDNPR